MFRWAFTRDISWLLNRARRINSRLILALDICRRNGMNSRDVRVKVENLLEGLRDYVVGVKIGLPTILSLGMNSIREILKCYRDYYFIADLKIADVGHIVRILCSYADYMGFDAVIVHAIIGRCGGLDEAVSEIHSRGGAVFSLCAMSHKGAEEVLNRNFTTLIKLSMDAGVDGFILPATIPEYITRARKIIGNKVILSPGIVAQGASVGSAVKCGADFEIIGRGIYATSNPIEKAREYSLKLKWYSRCTLC